MSLFGSAFRVMTFGESHGTGVGCVVDGVPAGLPISEGDVQILLDRRRPGQSTLSTSRADLDRVEILSGTENGLTLGSPVAMLVRNKDVRKMDYETTEAVPRPGHADFTFQAKYGIRASSGGGRSSARETIGRVCASAIALKYLKTHFSVNCVAFVDSVMEIKLPADLHEGFVSGTLTSAEVDELGVLTRYHDRFLDRNGRAYCIEDGSEKIFENSGGGEVLERIVTRCPHGPTAARMAARILRMKSEKDSCGGTICGLISNVPVGLGEPVFDKFQAELGKAMLSIPAVKGFEFGSGFAGSCSMRGSIHNDPIISLEKRCRNLQADFGSNNSGGVLGGITSGQNVYFRIAMKPVSSIGLPQTTCDFDGNLTTLTLEGRHDPCVLPRAVQIVESMAALTVMDLLLRNNTRREE